MQSALPKQNKFFYGWIVVGITVVVLLLAAGARSAPGVMIDAQLLDTGWDRVVLSSAVSLGLVVFGLGAPLAGSLIARFGSRLIALVGLLLMGLAMLVSAQLSTQTELNVFWGALSGLGTALAGSVIGAAVANRWFVARRGLVTGLFGAATSAGQLLFIPLLTRLTDTLGWRQTALILGVALLVLMLPVLLLMRDDPTKVGQLPYGALSPLPSGGGVTPDARGGVGVMATALRTSTFWLLAITFFVCGFSSNGIIGTHFKSYALDCGIPSGRAANLLAVMGAMNFVGTLASGWLTDRFDPRKLLAVYYTFRGISLLLLPFLNQEISLIGFMVLFGLDYIATVPPTIALCADSFGRKNVGTIYGWVFCGHMIGAALATSMGGYVRQNWGQFGPAFVAAGVLAVAAGALSLRIRRGAASAQLAAA
jgi:MFS family permease